jgi:hypothetical protein
MPAVHSLHILNLLELLEQPRVNKRAADILKLLPVNCRIIVHVLELLQRYVQKCQTMNLVGAIFLLVSLALLSVPPHLVALHTPITQRHVAAPLAIRIEYPKHR